MDREQPLVHVVDDDTDVRSLLHSLLTRAGYEVRAYPGPLEFLAEYAARSPQCLLLDVRLPRMSGLELQRRVAGESGPPVILLSGFATVQTALSAFRQGAEDFIEKPFEVETLLDAVQRAIDKDRARQRQRAKRESACRTRASLTAREKQVFELVARGRSSKNVAYELGLSKKTVDLHRGNLMRKLGASSLADLLRVWLQAGGQLEAAEPRDSNAPAREPDAAPSLGLRGQ